MNVLITGNKGFIGSHLQSALSSIAKVYGYDIGDSLPDTKFDIIIHLAARGLIRESKRDPYGYYKDGLDLTMKFLELARKHDSVFVFPNSGSARNPTNPYSLSKKQSVEWIELYRKLYGLKAYVLTLYNIYGEGSRKGAVYLFTKAALRGETAIVYGDGSHERDYFYVGDLVRVVLMIVSGKLKIGDYECGTGKGTSVLELIRLIENVTGRKVNYVTKEYEVEEADTLVAKNPVLKDYTPLEVGIRKVMDFIQNDKI
ncbi:MAG: NAD-dependent epimerase/dehydratase family protein [Metallosphaera prunae]|uniref:NAD-dependent epimerase/dehydratase family protein n=1 Tax=Metallosphaera prunae TaxID=47304 RepID=UPI00227311C1|nr:NAD-dependent epimerase/dehydratase family protein [Metallosphaera prunae]MCY0863307.1 NAD-dependent epimerase/dehydratase family protein [Metallosphaera prunae]